MMNCGPETSCSWFPTGPLTKKNRARVHDEVSSGCDQDSSNCNADVSPVQKGRFSAIFDDAGSCAHRPARIELHGVVGCTLCLHLSLAHADASLDARSLARPPFRHLLYRP